MSVIASRARSAKRPFGDAIEWFSISRMEIKTGKSDLGRLRSAVVVQSYPQMANAMDCFACASYGTELARDLLPPGIVQQDIFDLIREFYDSICPRPRTPHTEGDGNIEQGGKEMNSHARYLVTMKAAIELKLLSALGFFGDPTTCSACSCFIEDCGFWTGNGMVCDSCQLQSGQVGRRCDHSLLESAKTLMEEPFVMTQNTPIAKEVAQWSESMVLSHLGQRPKSLAFFKTVA